MTVTDSVTLKRKCNRTHTHELSVSQPGVRDTNLDHVAILNGSQNNDLPCHLTRHTHFINSLKCRNFFILLHSTDP